MFIQVIQGRCSDADRLRKQLDVWEQDLAPGADGFLGSTGGLTDDGTFVAVVRFDSREQADASSSRPEQDAWWQETSTCYDGEVAFHDYDDAFTMLDGGGIGRSQIALAMSSALGRLNSRIPVVSSQRIVPSAKMSLRRSSDFPRHCSGDEYPSRPLNVPNTVLLMLLADFAMPKSISLTLPSYVSITLLGATSR